MVLDVEEPAGGLPGVAPGAAEPWEAGAGRTGLVEVVLVPGVPAAEGAPAGGARTVALGWGAEGLGGAAEVPALEVPVT